MPRKQTKSGLTRKLDSICSQIVRSRGICQKCGPAKYFDFSQLQCAHIYSRTYRSVRWDLANMLSLCASCHFYFHRNPVLFGEFVRQHLGDYEYTQLKLRATPIKQWKLNEMIELYESLKSSTGNLRA